MQVNIDIGVFPDYTEEDLEQNIDTHRKIANPAVIVTANTAHPLSHPDWNQRTFAGT